MKVHDQRAEFEALGTTVAFVAFDDPDLLRRTMLVGLDLRYPLLVDRDRSAYRTWGLPRLPWYRVWLDPAVWVAYVRILRRGGSLRGLGSDTRQMGGDFVVDARGLIAYSRPQQRDDRPPVGALRQTIAALADSG